MCQSSFEVRAARVKIHAAPDAFGRKPRALRRWCRARRAKRAADGGHLVPLRLPFLGRTLHLTVDSSILWVGAALMVVSAVLLAFVRRLPLAQMSHGFSMSSSSLRITRSTSRRLRVFAVRQIAASFVLLAGAGMPLKTLLALQVAHTGFDTRQVLALNVPVISCERMP